MFFFFHNKDEIGRMSLGDLKASGFFELPRNMQEKYVIDILSEIANSSGKNIIFENQLSGKRFRADAFAPEGIFNFSEPTAIYLYAKEYENDADITYDWIKSYGHRGGSRRVPDFNLRNLIIVINNDKINLNKVAEQLKNMTGGEFSVMSLAQVLNRGLPSSINYTVFKNFRKFNYEDEYKLYINMLKPESLKNLRIAFEEERLTLFLGAGASVDAGLPDWSELVDGLWTNHLSEMIEAKDLKRETVIKELGWMFGESPTIRARILRSQMGDSIFSEIKNRIYLKDAKPSRLLESIAKLATPPRDSTGLQAIFTFNYDDLVERYLENLGVQFRTIVRDGDNYSTGEIPVYHIHGFLDSKTQDASEVERGSIVFTEDSYHTQIQDVYSWNNLTMLNQFRYSTCLFVGCSLVDPNLRRLLEYNAKKSPNNRHYAILRCPKIDDQNTIENAMRINFMKMQVNTMNELGVVVIWVENFEDIPQIINSIRS